MNKYMSHSHIMVVPGCTTLDQMHDNAIQGLLKMHES